MLWKFYPNFIQMHPSLQTFTHVTAAVLSWHVQNMWRYHSQGWDYSETKFQSILNYDGNTSVKWVIGLRIIISDTVEITYKLIIYNPGFTFLVSKHKYSGITSSILLLLMPWFLAVPGHQQKWYCLCSVHGSSLPRGRVSTKCTVCYEWRENANTFSCFLKFSMTRCNCGTHWV